MGETYIRTREDMVREFRGEKKTKGHFQFRLCMAAFLFLLFFATDRLGISYPGITRETIVSEISENEDISLWQGRIAEVFKTIE